MHIAYSVPPSLDAPGTKKMLKINRKMAKLHQKASLVYIVRVYVFNIVLGRQH